MPFERLMEEVAAIDPGERDQPLRVFAERWGEPAERIIDAINAVRVMRGERTYISLDSVEIDR
jgi:hypothetical protein